MSSSSSSHSPSPIQESEQKEGREASIAQVLKYHDQTKHSFTNYARGPRGLDWANQPNPFRRYVSSPLISLLHPPGNQSPLYSQLFNSLPSPQPVSYSTISQFFYDSLALSAWKSTGFSTWSLRVNPSSGNLHPTEAYLISPPIESICSHSFVAHYAPKEHSLEIRAEIPFEFFAKNFPKNSFLVGLSSIFWREAWKYGERAFRYCNHDVGHAIAAVAMAAAGLGWDVKVLDGLGYTELKKLMGLDHFPEFKFPDRQVKGRMPEIEFEHPDCVLLVFPSGLHECKVDYKELSSAILEFSDVEWKGKPNLLSKEHSSGLLSESSYKGFSLRDVVRKRRSAVDMDGKTGSGSGDKCKRQLALPFRALGWECDVHAALFVHRVVGLPSGLYFLVRNENHLDGLRKATRSEFKWEKPDGCPNDLPLYELARGDCQELSKRLSCHQLAGELAGEKEERHRYSLPAATREGKGRQSCCLVDPFCSPEASSETEEGRKEAALAHGSYPSMEKPASYSVHGEANELFYPDLDGEALGFSMNREEKPASFFINGESIIIAIDNN
nr:Nitroreductase family protein isoform 1 [Ipomoea batatas]